MDFSEKRAREHLVSRGYSSIEYEPDGNVPPDFLVDNRIAVEVRRLLDIHSAAARNGDGSADVSKRKSRSDLAIA